MKPCLFSVSYAGLWGQATLALPEFVSHAGELGFRSVMLMAKRPHFSPLDATPSAISALKDNLHEAGVQCDVLAAYTNLSPLPAPEVPVIEFQIAYVEALARIAAGIGTTVIRIFTAYETPGQDPQANWQRVIATIREMCDRIADHGVTLAIQNHHDVGLDTDALLELRAEVDRPNCRLGFDAWSPSLRGENVYEAAKKAAPHTVLTTNADYQRVPRYRYRPEVVNYERLEPDWVRAVPFGTGFIDYAAFFQGLQDGGFKGIAAFEMCSPLRGGGSLDNLDAAANAYLTWMRQRGFTEQPRRMAAVR